MLTIKNGDRKSFLVVKINIDGANFGPIFIGRRGDKDSELELGFFVGDTTNEKVVAINTSSIPNLPSNVEKIQLDNCDTVNLSIPYIDIQITAYHIVRSVTFESNSRQVSLEI